MREPVSRPLVSVLLPVRDGGDRLLAAVESLCRQEYRELDILVVDDHSTDGAPQRAAALDPRVRVLPNPGRGIVAALNAGAAAARGALLARMDADDIAHPQRIGTQVALLAARPDLGIVGAQVEVAGGGAGWRRYVDWLNGLTEPGDIAREIFVESPIPHPTAMFRREVFQDLGGYREVPWPEDYDLWLRAWAAGVAMAKPEGVLLTWRDHPARLSRASGRYGPQAFRRARAHFLARTLLRNRAAVVWGAGPTGRRLADALLAEGVDIAGFIDVHPRRVGGTKRGRLVHGPGFALRAAPALVVVAVGAAGAREEIRGWCADHGLAEGTDFIFAA